jgi:hypothetical protein
MPKTSSANCANELSCCGQTCVDEQADPAHCGSCAACNLPQATAGCSAGVCTIASCGAGYANCNSNPTDGCEVYTAGDVNNCGGCGQPCSADQTCTGGACVSCPSGQAVCTNACVDTTSDLNNCGGCGTTCSPDQTCTGGACVSCPSGQTVCNNACVDITSDLSNCGGCGTTCSPGQICSAGSCVTGNCRSASDCAWEGPSHYSTCDSNICNSHWCDSDMANCDQDNSNGCEANIQNDPSHCGSCGPAAPTRHVLVELV